MPARVVVTGIVFVIMTAILVFVVEFFLPLSMKSDMDIICRDTLLKMESAGGLTNNERNNMEDELAARGFQNVVANGTESARQGGSLRLHVETDYNYDKMTALFVSSLVTQHMSYDKTSMSRKVVN